MTDPPIDNADPKDEADALLVESLRRLADPGETFSYDLVVQIAQHAFERIIELELNFPKTPEAVERQMLLDSNAEVRGLRKEFALLAAGLGRNPAAAAIVEVLESRAMRPEWDPYREV